MIFTKNIKKLILENKLNYLLTIIALTSINALKLLIPQLTGYAFNSIFSNNTYELPYGLNNVILYFGNSETMRTIFVIAILILIVAVLHAFFNFLMRVSIANSSESIGKKIRDNLYHKLSNMPYSKYGDIATGDIIQRCTSDVTLIEQMLSSQLTELYSCITLLIFVFYFMARMNITLTLFSCILLPFLAFFSYFILRRLETQSKILEENEGALSTCIQENVTGTRVVRSFGMEKYELNKFKILNDTYRDNGLNLVKSHSYFWGLTDAISQGQVAITTVLGAYLGYKGYISIGEYVAFIALTNSALQPVKNLSRVFSHISRTKISIERIEEVLAFEQEDFHSGKEKPSLNTDIKIQNLSLTLDDTKILDNISFNVKKGESIGVIGTTGSGKSTLMLLLLRIHQTEKDTIKFGNIDINDIDKKYLRSRIGVVLQDNFLYAKTIRDNLKMANSNIDDNDIIKYSKVASIDHSIKEFDHGYNTMVGEKGVTLSGGQKQRLTIARTLMKDSDILIFDDSLSAVDTETDRKIREALNTLYEKKTTFIVSQRISTIKDCDKILVLEHGKLTNIGTHQELINKDGFYKKVWNIQK